MCLKFRTTHTSTRRTKVKQKVNKLFKLFLNFKMVIAIKNYQCVQECYINMNTVKMLKRFV